MRTRIITYSLVGIAVVVAAVFGARYFLSPPDEVRAMPGRIAGTTNYPGEYIPEQIVCAQPVSGGDELCTDVLAGDPEQSAPTWSITAPAGQYYVSSRVKDPSEMGSDMGDHRAYYSQYVVCGQKYECTDHAKLPVTVTSDRTTDGISPYDWYLK